MTKTNDRVKFAAAFVDAATIRPFLNDLRRSRQLQARFGCLPPIKNPPLERDEDKSLVA